MAQNTNVITRFFAAVGLTLRFAVHCLGLHIPLFMLVLITFHLKTENAVLCGVMYFGTFFTVAFLEHGRGTQAIRIVAALAGVGAVAVATYCANSDDDSSPETVYVNPTTGLPMVGGMGGVDAGGNAYGASSFTSSNDDWSSSTLFDSSSDFHHSVNPANGLPMMNDAVDIHGNAFGTNSMDDMFSSSSSSSMFDDSWSSSSSSSSSMFDT